MSVLSHVADAKARAQVSSISHGGSVKNEVLTSLPETVQPQITWFIGPDSEWLWALLQVFTVTVSLVFIYRQIRLQSQANMLSALFTLRERWESPAMAKLRAAVSCAFVGDRWHRHFRPEEERVATFFDDIGLYLKHKAFTATDVWDQYSYYIEHYWLIMKPLIQDFRSITNDKTWYENFERLYESSLKVGRRRGRGTAPQSESQLVTFAKGEVANAGDQRPTPTDGRSADGLLGWLLSLFRARNAA